METLAAEKTMDINDEELRDTLRAANLNALRLAVYQATLDPELADMEVIFETDWNGSPPYDAAHITPEQADIVIEKAVSFLKSGQPSKCPHPDDARLRQMMNIYAGQELNDFLFHFGKEEIRLEEYPRGVEWKNEPAPEVKAGFKVLVIGAGVSGLVTGVQLKRLGIPFEIIERNESVGGTWWVNDYPDARVDVASHHYQLSFIKKYPWKHWFAPQPEIREYIEHVAKDADLLPDIRFRTEVVAARWDEEKSIWHITLRLPDGSEEKTSANVIISAAGLFNATNLPDIPGIETYRGKMFHTTQWDHGFDYSGRNVGLIGVGCTGAQLARKVAEDAGHMTIFQRSPQWVAPVAGYRDEIPQSVQWLFDHVPHYWNWHCFSVFHTMFSDDGALQALDHEWRAQGGLVNRRNDQLRKNITAYIQEQLAHDPELAAKCTPDFPPVAKRLVVDNGWFEALRRPNVDLVTSGIETLTADGVTTKDGKHHPLDLIILGVGFKTERYLWPTHYEGRGGLTLEKAWAKDGARAYLGAVMPGFPNLFIIYGPNMQARAGGLFAWLEIWSRYAVRAIVNMIEGGHRSIECRQDVFDKYNADLDEADKDTIWGHTNADSYYVNEQGRQGVNNPFRPSKFYAWVKDPDMEDYNLN